MNRTAWTWGLLGSILLSLTVPAAADDFTPETGFTSLFSGKDLSG